MIFLVLLLPTVAMGVAAVGLAVLANRRIGALERSGEDVGRTEGRVSASVAVAVTLGALLLGLPLLYLVYVMVTAPPFD